jgi:hypothetical protein
MAVRRVHDGDIARLAVCAQGSIDAEQLSTETLSELLFFWRLGGLQSTSVLGDTAG